MRVPAVLQLAVLTTTALSTAAQEAPTYGVDVSFPIHHRVSTNYDFLPHNTDPSVAVPVEYKEMPIQPLGDRQAAYVAHVDACRKHYGTKSNLCDVYEYDRMLMTQRQPQSMTNYTDEGFKKLKAPSNIVELVTNFWEKNKYNQVAERWPDGNTYTNSWEAPTYMVSVDDTRLRGSGYQLKRKLWDATKEVLEEWTDEDLEPTSLYGIRVYTEGAILLPHVDRLPLVSSAMVCVAKDVDEDWPMEIYDHDGVAHNVTLEVGDMLLFESHSILHGRPFPLKGRYYAMMFIHFEPTGHSISHGLAENPDVEEQYKQASKDGVGGQSASNGGLPPYINRESPEEAHWKMQHPEGWHTNSKPAPSPARNQKQDMAQKAAAEGNVKALEKEITQKKEIINKRDENGWQIVHEAARGGHKEAIELLVQNGAQVNTRTFGGVGETPLHIANRTYGPFHPVVQYLKSLGALDVGAEL